MSDSSGPLIDGLADGGLDQSQQQIQAAIDAAKDSLPEGESDGVCVGCNGGIELGRLDLIPGTQICADCARKAQSNAAVQSLN